MSEKLDMASPNMVSQNIQNIAQLFPNCVTEAENGLAIDFDLLKQELSADIVDGLKERYRLEWPGKREAVVTANLPTNKTLRPVREESVDFDKTENLYIEGDNLEVLKLLQESYLGKIKMIYIDPPYNTGKDFVYKDNFTGDKEEHSEDSGFKDELQNRLVQNPDTSGRYHSDWLTMMYPRLKLARNLLTDDGVIFISIDDNEVHNLRKMCDEIFGENNFIALLVWENREGGGGSDSKLFRIKHEYVMVYGRDTFYSEIKGIPITNEARYTLKDSHYAERGPYYLQKLGMGSLGYISSLDYPIDGPEGKIWPNTDNRKINRWRWGKEKVIWGLNNNYIEFKKDSNNNWQVYTKQYMNVDNEGNQINRTNRPLGVIPDYSSTQANKGFQKIFSEKVFDYPKPVDYINYLVNLVLRHDNNDVILDFFSGSATTAHSVLKLNAEDGGNRKFIMVQLPEETSNDSEAKKAGYDNICEIGKERIRRAGKQIVEQSDSKEIDYGFRVYRLDSSNMQEVYYTPSQFQQKDLELFADNVKPGRTADDLVAQIMLDWGLPLSLKIEKTKIAGKEVHKIDEDALFCCFDSGIAEDFAKEVANYKPMRIVFRDSSFASDTAKENVKQLLKQLSPETEMKVL